MIGTFIAHNLLYVCACAFTIYRGKESDENYACIIMCSESWATKKKKHCKLGNRHSGGHFHSDDGTDVELQGRCKSNSKDLSQTTRSFFFPVHHPQRNNALAIIHSKEHTQHHLLKSDN